MFHRPPSGTRSPFASWRDYQQDTGKSQLQHEIIADDTSASTGTWKASEFGESSKTDYFSEPITEEEPHGIIEEEPHVEPVEEPAVPNLEEPFDFIENLDNVLEAIGMRGNLFMLLKNSTLMSLMINLCLCVTVWIPYIIGRSFILIRPNSLITKPIYMLRLLSDPVIDLLLDNILRVYNNFEMICGYVLPTSILTTIKLIHGDIQSGLYYIVKSIHITLHDNGGGSLSQLLSETTSNILDRTNTIQNWKLIQSNIYSISVIIFKRLRQCATDQGSLDRVVCTIVGYMILISIGSWYLSKNKNTNGSTNEILRQQGVFLKVLFFIFLELIVFPTVCGVLLDISTLPLFTEYTIKSRFHFVLLNPYSGGFLHWFVGTGFIFNFSVFVALVREVVRPGVLFFVPDPNDSQFHPVQDIVDQPILVLLRHLFTITATYFMLILVGMGFVTLLVSKYGGIYPIIWKFDIPISSLPIDLLAVQFLLPPIMSYIVPREFCKKSVTTWWHIVSRQLRLSSYMFGGRYPKEEVEDGGLVRVPTHDNVPIVVPRRRMIVPVDTVTLQPLLASEQSLGHPAISQSEERDTTIVYVPSLFYYRITIFLLLIWTTGSVLVCSISVVPSGPNRPVHDLYSFALGSYIMIVMSSFLNTIVQKYQLLRADGGTIVWSSVKQYLMNKAHKAVTFAYLLIVCGFVLPFLVGVIMELYIFMPLRLSNIDQSSLDIYITVDWAIGLAVLSLFYGVVNILPSHASFRETIIQFNWNNLSNLDIIHTSKKTIFPAILGLCFSIIFPSALTMAAIHLLDINDTSVKILIFRCAYPVVFCFVCLIFIFNAIISLIEIWFRTIRDDTYLIGKQLHNLNESAL
ncbi:hypothetical protein INT48_008273 [Thamnidium elegans]|uniref:RING-type E3 ubiquitin transferase n=1 Tax=Thamnidium elegans TaxID=101142 RepID=A0A8H7SG79_9FUNG|nr:hypothetical protein INT48_008273 [Thamnidium elegans]